LTWRIEFDPAAATELWKYRVGIARIYDVRLVIVVVRIGLRGDVHRR
jgi:hypothetical protein